MQVGGLPVTCNLTLPVACVAKAVTNSASAGDGQRFQYQYSKYSGWPEIKESLMSGRIHAGYMLAPLVMDLADKKIPVKIVSLGHRSGAVIMVRTESPYQRFRQLEGKRIAIPSRFAVDFLFLRKMLTQEKMTPNDIQIVEMAPPDMPAALYANAVDAYCTGEPFGAAAQRAGYARPLRMTRDEWRNYICCVLTVREELIKENPAMVQDLVNLVQGAGYWLDDKQANRDKAVTIASGRDFFNQDPKILQFVMDNPTDRVTYGDLRMIKSEFEELMQLSLEAGTIKHTISLRRMWTTVLRATQRRLSFLFESRGGHMNRALLSLLSLFLLTVAVSAADNPNNATLRAGVFSPTRQAPDFSLRGSDGTDLNLSRYRGKVVVLQFGYVSCPDVCPTTLAVLAQARKSLGGDASRMQVVYVTVDPERDTPELMRKYLTAFDPTFVGGTGTAEQMTAVRKSYGIEATKKPLPGGGYAVAHSSYTYLIDRSGSLSALMPYGRTPDDYVHDVKILLKQ